jgi:hypothetical protein
LSIWLLLVGVGVAVSKEVEAVLVDFVLEQD